MNQHVKQKQLGEKIPIISLIIVATVAFYWLCFAVNHFYQAEEATEFCSVEDWSDLFIEESFNDSSTEMNVTQQSNSSKLIRSLSEISEPPVELFELESDVYWLKLFISISWNEDFDDNQSRPYKNFALSIQHGIEDLYDKQFYSEEKSIAINVDNIERSASDIGMFVKMKVFVVEGNVEITELKSLVEDQGKVSKLVKEIERKINATAMLDSEDEEEEN